MHTRNEQLAELLSLTTPGFSELAEALITFSFELMASEDPAVRIASRRMVSRIAEIRAACGPVPAALDGGDASVPGAED